MPESLDPIPPAAPAERLLRFEAACEVIWPALRHFGLCGCHPQYMAAIVEIADLLGINSAPAGGQAIDAQSLILSARKDARDEIAAWVASAPQVRGKVGAGLQKEFAELISKLQISND